jgi:hypothetical protein
MKKFQVQVGGFYVNESKRLVREITQDARNSYVHWKSYQLSDGEPTGDSLMCSTDHIIRWANREATPEEAAKMKRHKVDMREYMRVMQLAVTVLHEVPDEQLFAEVRRRGRTVI